MAKQVPMSKNFASPLTVQGDWAKFARQLERELATNGVLLDILQKYNWRDESAPDTLKRIISERDSCTSALACAFDALKDHTRRP